MQRDLLYKRFRVKSVDPKSGRETEFDDIFQAAEHIKGTRPVKASKSALRSGIFKASNPHSRRAKYLGLVWITIGINEEEELITE